jgi:stage V sporulation protein B
VPPETQLSSNPDFVSPQAPVTAGVMYSVLARVLYGAASLVANALLARLLGPHGRGLYAALVLFATLGTLVLSLGLDQAAASLIAQRPSVARQAMRRGKAAAGIATLLLLVAGGIWAAFRWSALFGAPRLAFLLAVLGIPLGILGMVYGGALRGLNQIRTWNVGLLLEPCILIAGLPILLWTGRAFVTEAVALWLAAQVARLGFFAYRLHAGLPREPDGASEERPFVLFGLKIWVSQIVGTLNTRLDYFILLTVAGAAELGQYSTAVPIAEVITLGGAAIGTAVLPKFALLGKEASTALAQRAIRFATYAAVLLGVAVACVVPAASTVIFGAAFQDIVGPTWKLIPSYVFWSSAYVTTVYFIGSHQKPLINLWIALLATVIDVPLAYILGSTYGADGAAIASSASYAVAAVVNCVIFLRLSHSTLGDLLAGTGDDFRLAWALVRKTLSR